MYETMLFTEKHFMALKRMYEEEQQCRVVQKEGKVKDNGGCVVS